jgi:alpha-mannosidase
MKAYLISHTHWDREWYQTFQDYRARLVAMLDELIGFMEKNPAFKYYHLDGQTIVLEDYLEVRPENRKRLQRLIRQGRLIPGPWYVMPDETAYSNFFYKVRKAAVREALRQQTDGCRWRAAGNTTLGGVCSRLRIPHKTAGGQACSRSLRGGTNAGVHDAEGEFVLRTGLPDGPRGPCRVLPL